MLHLFIDLNQQHSKNWVASRPDSEILQFQIVRGSKVIEEHEKALVQVISNPEFDVDEQKTESGIMNYIKSGYDYSSNSNSKTTTNADEEEEQCDPFDDADCLVDNMYSMWADMEDYTATSGKSPNESNSKNATETGNTVKPWSSRSSPSGTWVRDPKTGTLRNIDE